MSTTNPMGEHYTAPEFTGLSCDATGCDEALTTAPLSSFSRELRLFMARADAAGWQVWAGRHRRVYCPAHEPRLGHRMHRVGIS